MRLEVFWPHKAHHTSEKTATFHAAPVENGKRRKANQEELNTLEKLLPTIQHVGGKVLGTDFISVVLHKQVGRLEIVMTKGITQNRKKDFASFRGWIELCAIQPN